MTDDRSERRAEAGEFVIPGGTQFVIVDLHHENGNERVLVEHLVDGKLIRAWVSRGSRPTFRGSTRGVVPDFDGTPNCSITKENHRAQIAEMGSSSRRRVLRLHLTERFGLGR